MGEENPSPPNGRTLPKRILGKTGLEVSALGYGSAPIGDLYRKLPERSAVESVVTALENGVNLVDTSPFYGSGLSELRVGCALREAKVAEVVLSTKVGRYLNPFSPCQGSSFVGGINHALQLDYSYDGTMRSIEQSLLRLGVSRINVALVHDLDVFSQGEKLEECYREAMGGAVKALTELREQGVINGYGVGVNEADMAERFARDCDPDAILLAGRYSLLEQPALDSFLPLAKERNIGVILGGVFNSGILATGPIPGARYDYAEAPPEILERVKKIEAVCQRHGTELRRAALQFVFGHPAVSCVVLGAENPAQVLSQIEDFQDPVPPALWADLKSENLLSSGAPTPS
jgi:D-threo-aldose 1-dehydrogenase